MINLFCFFRGETNKGEKYAFSERYHSIINKSKKRESYFGTERHTKISTGISGSTD